jgi:hypothetical protein
MQNTFEANSCACQRSSLGARVFPAMARVRPVPQRDGLASASTTSKRVKIVLWGNRRVGPECADDCDKSLASAFLNLTQSQIWHETVSNA